MTTRGLAYYRCSDPRQDQSVAQQTAWAKQAAARHGVSLARAFADDGIAGSEIDNRPGLQALLAFAEEQAAAGDPLDVLLVWDMDRLSRASSLRTAGVLARLMEAGVSLIVTAEGETDLSDDTDLLVNHVRQDFSHAAYSKKISKNVTRAMAQKAARGEFCGSRVLYGYERDPADRLTPGDPVKVRAVRECFERFAEGVLTPHEIAGRMNDAGVPSPSGKKWTRYTVLGILTNERYTGAAVYNVRRRGKYYRVRKGEVREDKTLAVREAKRRRLREAGGRAKGKTLPSERNEPADLIVVPDAHPALVTRELWEACQRRLASRRVEKDKPGPRLAPYGGAKRGPSPWSLTGLCFCGRCSAVMWGGVKSTTTRGRHYVYRRLVCSTARRYGCKGGCRTQAVEQEAIVRDVARLVQNHLLDPKQLARLRKRLDLLAGETAESRKVQISALKGRLAELEGRIDRGNENLLTLPPDRHPGVIAKLRQWEEERDRLARELDNLRAEGKHRISDGHVEEALELVRDLEEVVAEATPQEVRAALGRLVSKVTVHFTDDGAKACYSHVDVDLHPDFVNLLGPAGRACGRTHGRRR